MGGPNLGPSQQISQRQQDLAGYLTGLAPAMVGGAQSSLYQMQDLLSGVIPQYQAQAPLAGQALGAYQQQMGLQQPAIDFISGITSGDPSKMTAAAAPMLTQISNQYAQAGAQIDKGPRGAGSDFARAMLPVMQGDAAAQALAQPYLGAMNTALGLGQNAQGTLLGAGQGAIGNLGNIASGLGSFGLQEFGAGLSAAGGAGNMLSGAAQTQESIMQAQAQKKASTMGFLGNLAGIAGGLATGGMFGGGGLFGGGKSAGGGMPSSSSFPGVYQGISAVAPTIPGIIP